MSEQRLSVAIVTRSDCGRLRACHGAAFEVLFYGTIPPKTAEDNSANLCILNDLETFV